MATRTIPAKTEVICDVCGSECHQSFGKGRRRMEGRLVIKRHALDPLGDPAADGNVEFDLCDDCLNAVTEAINAKVRELTVSATGGLV